MVLPSRPLPTAPTLAPAAAGGWDVQTRWTRDGDVEWRLHDQGTTRAEGRAPSEDLARRSALSHRNGLATPPGPVTTAQAVALLGVTARTVQSWERRGHLTRFPGSDPALPRWDTTALLECEAARRATGRVAWTSGARHGLHDVRALEGRPGHGLTPGRPARPELRYTGPGHVPPVPNPVRNTGPEHGPPVPVSARRPLPGRPPAPAPVVRTGLPTRRPGT